MEGAINKQALSNDDIIIKENTKVCRVLNYNGVLNLLNTGLVDVSSVNMIRN